MIHLADRSERHLIKSTENGRWSKQKIDAAVVAIKRFYSDGVNDLKLKEEKPYGRSGSASEKELNAKKRKLISDDGFSKAKLNALLDSCRKAGWVLSRAHLIRLLSVPKGPRRNQLQAQLIKGVGVNVN